MKTQNIYRILKKLMKYGGREDFTPELISAQKLGISYEEWEQLIILLAQHKFVEGVVYTQTLSDHFPKLVDIDHIRIGLAGVEYLEESSLMKKAAELLRMAGEII